jgi:tetratricopeptide (TPR) repeat protein
LKRDTGNFVDMMKLASRHLALFGVDGDVKHITKADSLINSSSAKLNGKDADILFSLAQVTAMKHKFSVASNYTSDAEKAGGALYAVKLLSFDMDMERGEYDNARSQLSQLGDRNSFDYLIRSAKYSDHSGNLGDAILMMEKAKNKVSTNRPLYLWALSNLADMYGHAGKIKDSYDCYLKVLNLDPAYLYALKGIAWIAYSHDGNTELAMELLNHIASLSKSPDILLSIGEIAGAENKLSYQQECERKFIEEVSKPEYGDMYNKYLIDIYLAGDKNPKLALALATKEVESRPTPETYSWLARALQANGDSLKARDIAMQRILHRTFEPEIIFHCAKVLLATGQKKVAEELLNECLESEYELGPAMANEIRTLLK